MISLSSLALIAFAKHSVLRAQMFPRTTSNDAVEDSGGVSRLSNGGDVDESQKRRSIPDVLRDTSTIAASVFALMFSVGFSYPGTLGKLSYTNNI